MSDIVLNSEGDIDVTDFVGPRLFTDAEKIKAIAQHVTIRLRTFLGEWFLDLNEGVPYSKEILGRKGAEQTTLVIIRDTIANTPGVEAVEQLSVNLDDERMLTVRFVARTVEGPLSYALSLSTSPTILYSQSVGYNDGRYTYGG